ncbi:MAG: Histidinol phosphate phosphatase HisJ family [Pedosphaera sp.]|nr:Histidinol phosphate phosphatase HisJ family [Pedosphaera sp.]
MDWPADYHMHTPLCHHATGQPTEYAARAVALGIKEIGFSEHSPMPSDDFDEWRMYYSKMDEYVASVRQAQKDHPQLTIKLALEVDFMPGQEEWIQKLAGLHPWDYFIGSVHYVGNWDIDNPKKLSEWKKHDPYEVWSMYFDCLTQAAESGLFEIIGHADLPKKFGIYPDRDCTSLFERFLKAAAKHNVAMELNTAGLRKDCKEIYPSPKIVQLAKQHGVAITFGSDSHAPGEVGMNFKEAIELARSVGYTHTRRFTNRKAEAVAL